MRSEMMRSYSTRRPGFRRSGAGRIGRELNGLLPRKSDAPEPGNNTGMTLRRHTLPVPIRITFRYNSRIRFFESRSSAIGTIVNSTPFLMKDRLVLRNRFLTSCCVMVNALAALSPVEIVFDRDLNPLPIEPHDVGKSGASSAATTACCSAGEICSIGTNA